MVTELDLTVTNTWMNADTEQELFTQSSWSNPEDSLTQMDFIMTSRNLEMKHVKVLDSDWFKTAHRAVYAVLSVRPKMRYTVKNAANLRGWVPDESWHDAAAATLTDWKSWNKLAPLLVDTAKAHRKVESKEMSVTELELKSLLLREKKTGRYLERSELNWLCREIWRTRRALKREAPGPDQGECRDGESPQENAEQAFQLEINCKGRKSRIYSHKILSRLLVNLRRTGGVNPIRETTLGGAVEKHENRLCWWNVDLAKETGKCLEETETRERLTGSNHSRCFESIASRMFGKAGEVTVVDVLEHEIPGRLAVFGEGSESGGCNVLDQVQAYCWIVCYAKSLGLRLKSLPPLRYESVQTAFVPKTRADAGVFLLLKAAELSREWQRETVVVQLDVKKAFDHVDHRAAFKAMILQGVSLFSMALIAAIWSGSCMKACLGTVTSNKVQMSRGLPQGAPESPVIFTMIMKLVLRDLIKSWISRKLAWRLDDFALAAICYADDVVLIVVSVSAAETMVSEVIKKLKEVGLTNTLDEFPEDDGQKQHGGRIGCGVRGSFWSLWDRWCVWTGMQDM